MALKETIERIDALKKELDSLRPIKPEFEKRIRLKFRLDWTYHSNSIEGNTLSFGETKSLLLEGAKAIDEIREKNKPLQDINEILGHDEVITAINRIEDKEIIFTQQRIKEYHLIMLGREPFRIPAIDEAGNSTTRVVTPGQYKEKPNHVLKADNKPFYFEMPGEPTKAAMTELLDWINKEFVEGKAHPLQLASLFHYRFVRIHPFDDGNGRMARLLMNVILQIYEYPPAIVRVDSKKEYIRVLEVADKSIDTDGNIDQFTEYIGNELARSLDINVRGAKGEDIEEEGDIDKKFELVLKRLFDDKQKKEAKEKWRFENQIRILSNFFIPLVLAVEAILSKSEQGFTSVIKTIHCIAKPNGTVRVDFDRNTFKQSIEWFMQHTVIESGNKLQGVTFAGTYNGCMLGSMIRSIDVQISFLFVGDNWRIAVSDLASPFTVEKGLDEILDASEIKDIKKRVVDFFLFKIQ